MPQPSYLETCVGCGAEPGHSHHPECDHARCPSCGDQLIACSDHVNDTRPALWPGIDQRAEVCQALDWWTTHPGIDHLVEHHEKVLFAEALGQITWDPAAQRYVIGQVNDDDLTQAMLRAGGRR
ncbi:MAG TPA: hypothetical protein VGM53_34550 [Streptosporangiaceae bacterium]|jgi:hypothetical protein